MKPKPSNTLLPRKRAAAPKAITPKTPKEEGEDIDDDDEQEEEERQEEEEEEQEDEPASIDDAPAAKLSIFQRAKLRAAPKGKLIEQIAALQGKLNAAKNRIGDLEALEEEALELDAENEKLRGQIATGKKTQGDAAAKGVQKELATLGLTAEKLPATGKKGGSLLDQLEAMTSASERVAFMRANKPALMAEEAARDAAQRSKRK